VITRILVSASQNESRLEASLPNIPSNPNAPPAALCRTGERGTLAGDTDDPPFIQQRHAGADPEALPMNMNNRNFVRGLCLMAIALLFGGVSFNYSMGELSRSGPGLFPMMVSSFLFVIGLLTLVRSHFVEPVPLDYSVRNIALILLSLVGFALISEYINMILAIIFLVFCSTFAGTSYSVVRNIKISAGLIAVAFGFQYFLGLNLPLY
jgi:hypothetical protein